MSGVGLLAGRDESIWGAMGHWELVLGVRHHIWASPTPNAIFKCHIELFRGLESAAFPALLL